MSDRMKREERRAFSAQFHSEPAVIVRAPGRVNLMGEHTDYNEGFVLPKALQQETVLLARPREDARLQVYSQHFGALANVDLAAPEGQRSAPWLEYVLGVAILLRRWGYPVDRGAEVLVTGDLPVGAGLSSSAALEMAAVCLFEALGNFRLEDVAAARLGQAVEHEFLGLGSGIMDQVAARCCKAGHALFLDCRSHGFEQVPMHLGGFVVLIADTGSPRRLSASKYNARVAECRQAVDALQLAAGKPGTHLRDFSLDELEGAESQMPEQVFRRARHVIQENERALRARDALRAGNAAALGALLNASDASLREDYEVTSPELDAMTRIARALPGCLGARMTGAGFGGCTIHLVAVSAVESFGEELLRRYRAETGLAGRLLRAEAGPGASILEN